MRNISDCTMCIWLWRNMQWQCRPRGSWHVLMVLQALWLHVGESHQFHSTSVASVYSQSLCIHLYTVRPKNCTLYFYSNFVRSFYIEKLLVHIYPNKFGTNWNTILRCVSLCCLVKCNIHNVLWPMSVLSRKLKRHHYCLELLNETS